MWGAALLLCGTLLWGSGCAAPVRIDVVDSHGRPEPFLNLDPNASPLNQSLVRDAAYILGAHDDAEVEGRLWALTEHPDPAVRAEAARFLVSRAGIENAYGHKLDYVYTNREYEALPSPVRELCQFNDWWGWMLSEGLTWMFESRSHRGFLLAEKGAQRVGNALATAWFKKIHALFGPEGVPEDDKGFYTRYEEIDPEEFFRLNGLAEEMQHDVDVSLQLYALKNPEAVSVPLKDYPPPPKKR